MDLLLDAMSRAVYDDSIDEAKPATYVDQDPWYCGYADCPICLERGVVPEGAASEARDL